MEPKQATYEQIARWAVAAFMSSPEADDDELIEQLRTLGVPYASRAIVYVPIAFGRRILERMPLSLPPPPSDPLYSAAAEVARAYGRQHVEVIGPRSPEVKCVSDGLSAGHKPEDMTLSELVFWGLDDDKPAELPDVQGILDELIGAHGLRNLAWTASVWPQSVRPGQANLVFEVSVPCGTRRVQETFAGTGPNVAAATREAFGKFTRGSLHVLLATLVERAHGHDQVEWERCGERDVCIGPLLTLWSQPPPSLAFSTLLDALLARLATERLTLEPHWVRVFAAHRPGQLFVNEVLLDNEPWPAGEDVINAHPWPDSGAPYAVRHFLALP